MGRTRNHANFATGNNIFVDTTNNRVGVGTTVPLKTLHIYTADGDIRIGDISEGLTTGADAGVIFTGLGTVTSALFTEVDGTILSYGINCEQIIGFETGRVGGVFRLDTRTSGSYGDASCFVVKGRPIGSTTEYNALVVGLNNGNTYLSPVRGNVLVGTSSSTGTASQPLQVAGGGYFSSSVGIGTTNPTSTLSVGGTITELYSGTYWNLVSQADIGIGASQVPLNQYLGQLAFLDSYSPSGLRRDGGGSDDVVINSSGNLGINSTSPTSRLDVVGDAKILGVSTFTAANTPAVVVRSGASGSYTGIDIGRTGTEGLLAVASSAGVYAGDAAAGDIVLRANGANSKLLFTYLGNNASLAVAGSNVLVGTVSSTGTASQPLQVTGGAYVSGNLGIGTTNPTAKLEVSGDLNGTAFESYELDDLSTATNGINNTFIPKFNYDRVTITNPFRLMITVNGIPQSAFINNTDYVYQSNFLGSNNGFTIDTDNNIKFTESIPSGSDIVVRVLPVSNTATRIKYYPFKPTDILLGY